jgi:hypothetical protein
LWLRKLNLCCSSNCLSLSLAAMSPRALSVHTFFFGGSVTKPSTGALLEGNLQAKQVARGALFVGLNHEAEGFIPNFSQGCSDDARFVLVVLLCASLANLCICCRKIVLLDFRSLQILGKTCHWNMGRSTSENMLLFVQSMPTGLWCSGAAASALSQPAPRATPERGHPLKGLKIHRSNRSTHEMPNSKVWDWPRLLRFPGLQTRHVVRTTNMLAAQGSTFDEVQKLVLQGLFAS